MTWRRLSIASRLTLMFASVSSILLLVLGLSIGNTLRQHFVSQDMEMLLGKLQLIGHLLDQARSPDERAALPHQIEDVQIGHPGLAVLVRDDQGHTVYSTARTTFPEHLLQAAGATPEPTLWVRDGRPWRGIATVLPAGSPGSPRMTVAVGVDITDQKVFRDAFRQTLWQLIAIAAVLSGLCGWAVAHRGLAPLKTMCRAAGSVTANRLDFRLSADAVPQELVRLAMTLNDLFARLEQAFLRLQNFSSDLAHELRTPVSNLMTATQVALSQARDAAAYRDILASNAEEYERLARMISDMLFLAQADHGLLTLRREPFDVQAQVQALFEFFSVLAEEKNLRLTLSGSGRLVGDAPMLRRAIANLLSNAIRHAPPDGDVHVRISETREAASIAVENAGEPIPPEHRERIFDRFYRVDPARHHAGEGAGLGLAIARSIIRAHGGELSVKCGDGRVCFEARLPTPRGD